MRMKKSDFYEISLTILVIVDILVVILVTASILAPRQRTTKAQRYDFECVTVPKQAPLTECKK